MKKKKETNGKANLRSTDRPRHSRFRNIVMTLLTGGLLTAAWPTWGTASVVFIGLVPLLLVEGRVAQGEKGRVFWLSFLAFLVWNVATTWWVWNATPAATLAWILNSLFMATVFYVFHLTKKRVCNNPWGNFFLIPYWMAFEYLTYLWAAKWPWLNLGGVFSSKVSWIQWYEYTGVAGGTLWILLVNILITNIKTCTVQIILSSNNIFHSRTIFRFLKGQTTDKYSFIRNRLSNTFQLSKFSICPIHLPKNFFRF